jgi:AcrR family transcriptional regulator
MSAPAPRRGRPRDAGLNERALAATRDLLVEQGFAATTIQAVAGRSGVHASAIYRRWSSRIELIEEAVFPGFDPAAVRPTGDLRADLIRFVRVYVDTFGAPAARAAAAGLLAHRRGPGAQPPSPDYYLRVSARPQFRAVLAAAPAGAVDPAADVDDVFDLVLGAVLVRTLIPVGAVGPRPIERAVDLVLRALRPPTATGQQSHRSR